jgi:PAS domain S-box-containing protein
MDRSQIRSENPLSEEWLGAEILRGAGDAIIFADHGGIIRYWNGAAQVMFGYTPEEANGRSLDMVIPERLRQRHNEGYARAMATGTTKYDTELLKVPAVRKDGSSISLEFRVVLIGRPVFGVAAILRDVTADWQERKDLARRIADAEDRVKEVEARSK